MILGVKITGAELAKKAGISEVHAHRIAVGGRGMKVDTAVRVAKALGLSLEGLLARVKAQKKRKA